MLRLKFLWGKRENVENVFQDIPSKYKCLLGHYIHTILSSKLLLDEDMEVVMRNYNSKLYGVHPSGTVWDILLPITAAVVVLAESYSRPPILTVPLATVLCVIYSRYKYWRRWRTKNIVSIVANFHKLHRLNLEISNYLKVRRILSVARDAPKHVVLELKEFLLSVFGEEIELLKMLVQSVRNMYYFVDTELIYPQDWFANRLDSLKYFGVSEEYCEGNFQGLRDLGILLISNFLGCVGVIICPDSWKSRRPDLYVVFDQIVPQVEQTLSKTVKLLETQFDELRFTIQRDEDFKTELDKPTYKRTVKIERSLTDFLNQMQVAFDLGVALRNRLVQNPGNLGLLEDTVCNLREQVNVCDKFLEAFRKSYGLLVRNATSTRGPVERKAIEQKPVEGPRVELEVESEAIQTSLVTIRSDDEPLPMDEEYELYVTASDEFETASAVTAVADIDTTPSIAYLTAMIDELKGKLRERQALRKAIPDKRQSVADEKKPPRKFVSEPLQVLKPSERTSLQLADLLSLANRSCEEEVFGGEDG